MSHVSLGSGHGADPLAHAARCVVILQGALKSELQRKLTVQGKELEMVRSKHASVQKQLISSQQELEKTHASLTEVGTSYWSCCWLLCT